MILVPSVNEWKHKGHIYGECMSKKDIDLMYVYIPKNASSWTKPNLKDWGWEFYNYRLDNLDKHSLVILRDPVDRWLSGIAEYLTLYYPNMQVPFNETTELIFDRITFDDHTEKQVYFIEGLDPGRITFFKCDENYRLYFGQFLKNQGTPNRYVNYNYQHTTDNREDGDQTRSKFKKMMLSRSHKNKQYYLTSGKVWK
jgi:hypothetical protein